MFSCAGKPPENIGVTNGYLAPCPDSPNCVSSQSKEKKHTIAPLVYNGEQAAAKEMLKQVVTSMAGARIVTDTKDYLYAEFKSRIMGFVDDVEFYFPNESIIHVRSASRMGYSDLGVNRKRIETIRQRFDALRP
jgi:uncharacterized protein (DUF1499 family)